MKNICSFLNNYMIPKQFEHAPVIDKIASALFGKINRVKEDENAIRRVLLNCTPFPPFIQNRTTYINNIPDHVVIKLLHAYIADGGTRTFKNILDPESDIPVSESDSDSISENEPFYHNCVDYESDIQEHSGEQ